MPRVKRGSKRRERRKKILALAKGYFLTKSKLYRSAKEAIDRAGNFAYVGPQAARSATSAACGSSASTPPRAPHDMSYSQFIAGLKRAGVELDRKSLADIAAARPDGVRGAGGVGAQGGRRRRQARRRRPPAASRRAGVRPRSAGPAAMADAVAELKDAGPRAPRGLRGRAPRGRGRAGAAGPARPLPRPQGRRGHRAA